MNKIIINIGVVSIFFLLFACSGPTKSIDAGVDIIGTITEINAEQLGILIEEDPIVTGPGEKRIWLYISKETEIYKEGESKPLIKIKSEDLKIGLKVKGWAGQAVLLSNPAHADALQIVVFN